MTMSGSTSNTTTQWTFRDGRDYVLSMTTTEVPNTVSFWVSDKITSEEWTGSYDESGIEVITRRTGCFKSFQTFVSMIKSALLKKSDGVILELLNIEDLTAISIQRQHQAEGRLPTSSTESRALFPLNFRLYNSEINSTNLPPSAVEFSENSNNNPPTAPALTSQPPPLEDAGTNNAIANPINNTKPSVASFSQLNKRKYLIVTYIAEFDKVHYPLPLNYSNPPDLNVMQKNIIHLKAEVVSLQSEKKELANALEAIKTAPPRRKANSASDISSREKPAEDGEKQFLLTNCDAIIMNPVMESQSSERKDDGLGASVHPGGSYTKDVSTVYCKRCSRTIDSLREKLRDLEETTNLLRREHTHAMDRLEEENNFLHDKVTAAANYEIELWAEIKSLKEKAAQAEADLDKERKKNRILEEQRKEVKTSPRRSRHDMFYGKNNKEKSVQTITKKPIPKSIPNSNSKGRGGGTVENRSTSAASQRSYRSVSGASYRTVRSEGKSDSTTLTLNSGNRDVRNSSGSGRRGPPSSSPRTPKVMRSSKSGLKPRSESPSKARFDPTTYVAKKQQKLGYIASLRMNQIQSSLNQSNSGTRIRPVSRPNSGTRIRPVSRPNSGSRIKSVSRPNSGTRIKSVSRPNSGTRIKSVSRPNSVERPVRPTSASLAVENKRNHGRSPYLGGKYEPKKKLPPKNGLTASVQERKKKQDEERERVGIAQPRPRVFDTDDEVPYWLKKVTNKNSASTTEVNELTKREVLDEPVVSLPQLTTPEFIAEINKRVRESTEELLTLRERQQQSRKEDSLNRLSKHKSFTAAKKTEDEETFHDIAKLQTKLSALMTFLETCKPQQGTALEESLDWSNQENSI